MYIYIYIYIYYACTCVYIYIYIHIHTYIHIISYQGSWVANEDAEDEAARAAAIAAVMPAGSVVVSRSLRGTKGVPRKGV